MYSSERSRAESLSDDELPVVRSRDYADCLIEEVKLHVPVCAYIHVHSGVWEF